MEMDVRRAWLVFGSVLVAVVAGCSRNGATPPGGPSYVVPVGASSAPTLTSAPTSTSAPTWTEPASYGFVLTRGCNEGAPLGRYRVTVKNRAVARVDRIDASGTRPHASADVDLGPVTGEGEEIEVPTLRGLLEMAQTTADDGGEVSRAFDATDGHPVKVMLNVSDNTNPSDAECFSITDYGVTG